MVMLQTKMPLPQTHASKAATRLDFLKVMSSISSASIHFEVVQVFFCSFLSLLATGFPALLSGLSKHHISKTRKAEKAKDIPEEKKQKKPKHTKMMNSIFSQLSCKMVHHCIMFGDSKQINTAVSIQIYFGSIGYLA